MIDIGGPTMIRAAAKNHESVAVITEPDDYAAVLDELKANGGELSPATCRRLATKAFHRTAHYDFVIANWFSETEGDFPEPHPARLRKGHGALLRREPPPARRLLRRKRRPPPPAQPRHPAPRQEALVQQPLRPARGALAGHRVRPAGLRDHQAQQPLRLGPGREPRARLPQGAREPTRWRPSAR